MTFKLSLEDVEFIKILANSDAALFQKEMNEITKKRLEEQIGTFYDNIILKTLL